MAKSYQNEITGAYLVTKAATNKFREGHERIFGKSKHEQRLEQERAEQEQELRRQESDYVDNGGN